MSVQSDKWIIQMARDNDMISPFEDKQVRGDKISFGVSSYGYDARVSDEFKIFTNVNSEIVDPKNFKSSNFITKNSSECIIPPNSFVLARTVEYFTPMKELLNLFLLRAMRIQLFHMQIEMVNTKVKRELHFQKYNNGQIYC